MSISIAGWVSRKFIVGNKALTAGQKARLVAVFGLERQSLRNRASGDIAKGRGFHSVRGLPDEGTLSSGQNR